MNREAIAPLFPLPDLYLLPNTLLPLHIFEPRYRQMVEDLLDGSGHLVIGTLQSDDTRRGLGDGAPRVQPVAGLGRLESYQRLDDGRFIIGVVGVARVHIQEAPSDRLYRQVSIELLEEVPERPQETEGLRDRLLAALLELADNELKLPEEQTVGHLTDLLLLYLKPGGLDMEKLYSCLEVSERARSALELADSIQGGPS